MYAKVLIEITLEKPLPSKLSVRIAKGHVAVVDVHYIWKPEICMACHFFGHIKESRKVMIYGTPLPFSDRVPLPRPPSMSSVLKVIRRLLFPLLLGSYHLLPRIPLL